MLTRPRPNGSDRLRLASGIALALFLLLGLLLSPAVAAPPSAEEPAAAAAEAGDEGKDDGDKKDDDAEQRDSLYYEVTVTATRTEEDVFDVPNPVAVVGRERLRQRALGTVTDHMRDLVGVDVNGVGANQPRPIIRGQRGQRVLLLKDGLRMNNFRRQTSFGELPALFDVAFVDRLEVVRGPGSVLYGSDAIGGVVNVISRPPAAGLDPGDIGGNVGYRFDSAGDGGKFVAALSGWFGNVGWTVEGTYRDQGSYNAPNGRFGDIQLANETFVADTGVQDESLRASFRFALDDKNVGTVELETYDAEEAGFGFVDPDAYDPGSARIRILYPDQNFDQVTLGHQAARLEGPLANRVQTSVWLRSNERDLAFDILIPFGPGAGLQIDTENFTDLDSFGLRSEASKAIGSRHVVTYGLDYLHDDSYNTDFNRTTMFGFGPPMVTEDRTPTVPNASYESVGVFVQDDWELSRRVALILGGRYQRTQSKTRPTEGLEGEPLFDSTDDAVVGAANLIVTATDNLKVVANVGSAFRSPNLIERFFNGPTPEGFGFQSRNLGLEPETSVNVDVGIKYRRRNVAFETFLFRNTIRDGIRIAPTGGMVGPFPEFQNVNIDELRYEGLEMAFDVTLAGGLSFGLDFTRILSEDVLDENNPVSEGFTDKVTARARYTDPRDRFFAEYGVRHVGENDDPAIFTSPVGDVYPSFTVHRLLGGVKLYERRGIAHRLGIEIDNLSDELYAEFSNASFFRPEPGRTLRLDWRMDF